jgi:glutaconate CoA-transferase subunit A
VIENPFGRWAGASRLVAVPAIHPDVTLLHVQQADAQGTARIHGLTFADVEQAKAARRLVLTCEEVVETEALRYDPDRNNIPFFNVDAVVPVPWGAYPTACFRYYDYDPRYLSDYRTYASSDDGWQSYLETFVYGVSGHEELLDRMGAERREAIRADGRTGYANNLDRR